MTFFIGHDACHPAAQLLTGYQNRPGMSDIYYIYKCYDITHQILCTSSQANSNLHTTTDLATVVNHEGNTHR